MKPRKVKQKQLSTINSYRVHFELAKHSTSAETLGSIMLSQGNQNMKQVKNMCPTINRQKAIYGGTPLLLLKKENKNIETDQI